MQRLLLDILLNSAEMEDCVCGFRVGRSIVDNAKPHGGSVFVLNIDIQDFFPTIHFGRVKGFFHRRFGFPEEVAVLLAQLTTHNGILPQGAPTSPAIANLVCQKLDKRLAAWAEKEEFQYTRYVDDMTFSSNDGRLLTQIPFILKIINDEGFDINPRKLRVMRRGGRQEVTGLVVNRKRPSLPRERLRWLRVVIHNCRKHGMASQAQKAIELGLLKSDGSEGRSEIVAFKNFLYGHAFYVYMVRPDLGAKMLADLRKLDWPRQVKSPLGKPGTATSSSASGAGARSRTTERSSSSGAGAGGPSNQEIINNIKDIIDSGEVKYGTLDASGNPEI
jgi:hypothetical protein